MTNSSSRILRSAEQNVVTPIHWRATPPAQLEPAAKDARTAQAPGNESRDPQGERERVEREAYHRGLSEGQAAGRDQAGAELQPVLDQLGRALASLTALRSRIRTEAEGDLLKLAVAIARRVLHRELTLDPESIEGLIRVALEKLQTRELCRVRVHPDQEAAIRSSLERFSNSNKVEVTADSSMQCGDVVFETAQGNLDASIESQLQEIERGLADRLHRPPQNRLPLSR
jgi:flagellar assembly protein FliH